MNEIIAWLLLGCFGSIAIPLSLWIRSIIREANKERKRLREEEES